MWQPIKTALLTHGPVLLFVPDDFEGAVIGTWDEGKEYWCYWGEGKPLHGLPTHWCSLPDDPPPDCIDCDGKPCWLTASDDLILCWG